MCIADVTPGWAEVEEQRLEALAHTARVLARLRTEADLEAAARAAEQLRRGGGDEGLE